MKLANAVSVIIPAYNRARSITDCLDSVCNQTEPALEVIVIDDRSTDATAETVRNYGRLHPSVRCVVLERHSGAQAARNRGILEARGEWIAFQDSDDQWVPEKLEKQLAALTGAGFDPLTVVHADAWRQDADTGARSLWKLKPCEGSVHSELLRLPNPFFPAMLTSKRALEQIGLLDENIPSHQEWDTAIRLAKACRFIHLHEPLFVYRFHAGDAISRNRKADIDGYQYVVDKHRDEILRLCGADALNRHLRGNAVKAMRLGYYAEALDILGKAPGSSAHIALLKWVARRKISLRLYDFVAGIAHKVRPFRETS